MTTVRLRFRYSQGSVGATEIYWLPSLSIGGGPANTQAAKLVNDLLAARTACMFENQVVNSVTLSYEGVKRASLVLKAGVYPWPSRAQTITIPGKGGLSITAVSRRPEQLKVAVAMRMTFGPVGGLEARTSTRYFSTVPDSVTNYDDEGVLFSADGPWWQKWKAFRQVLTGAVTSGGTPFVIKCKQRTGDSTPIGVSGLVVQAAAPSLVGIQVPTGAAPAGWLKGTLLDLTAFKMADCPCPTINGRWTVESRNDTLTPGYSIFYLLNSASVDVTKVKRMGTAQLVAFEYLPIVDAVIVNSTTHQRGNAGLRRHGRRKSRCCKV